MLYESATVVAWENGVATLKYQAKSGCSSCESRQQCGVHTAHPASEQPYQQINVVSEQSLTPGQNVHLLMQSSGFIKSVLLAYLLPLLFLFIGIACINSLFEASNFNLVMGAMIGFFIGLGAVYLLCKIKKVTRSCQPQIIIP